MNFDRTGIIVYVLKYKECINFYKNIIGLKILFKNETLCCFEFGRSYLMVEVDDEFKGELPTIERIRSCLRMNVPNVKSLAKKLQTHNIEVDYQEHNWGIVAKFFDPDGNLCAFKDSTTFEQQVLDYEPN